MEKVPVKHNKKTKQNGRSAQKSGNENVPGTGNENVPGTGNENVPMAPGNTRNENVPTFYNLSIFPSVAGLEAVADEAGDDAPAEFGIGHNAGPPWTEAAADEADDLSIPEFLRRI